MHLARQGDPGTDFFEVRIMDAKQACNVDFHLEQLELRSGNHLLNNL